MSKESQYLRLASAILLGVFCVAPPGGFTVFASTSPGPKFNLASHSFERQVKPLFEKYCYSCHGEKKKGSLDLRSFVDNDSALQAMPVFEKVMGHLKAHDMPPDNKPQPSSAEFDSILSWIDSAFFPCDCNNPNPGRVTVRRLNRVEYNNTIRDLVGVKFQPANDFPADDSGYGFDNIGDVLSLSPLLLEKYLAAAENIMEAAIVSETATNGQVRRFPAERLESTAPGGPYGNGARILNREGEVFSKIKILRSGEYTFRARAFAQQAGPEPARMEFRIDGKPPKVVDVKAVENSPAIYEIRLTLEPGEKQFGAAYINNYVNPKDPDPNNRDRNLIVEYLELTGPLGPQPLPETHKLIFSVAPTTGSREARAHAIIHAFATRAFRRPISADELDRFMELFRSVDEDKSNFEQSIRLVLEAVLVSPRFLFRGEPTASESAPDSVAPIDEYALATRLSYFLWSSMPDEQLFAHAARGTLRRNLDAEVHRMLADPKADALVENFTGQWLQLRNLKLVTPDAKVFPGFNDSLREAMRRETELFFRHILIGNRSVLEFLDADYTFANEPLAKLYNIDGVKGSEFRQVALKSGERGGLIRQASILTITSNPTRTSPVKRGKWVLENILGSPPPPPPPNVPLLKEGHEAMLTGTLRQRMVQHREDPACASCHARMDPIGFGLENFDGIGQWREREGEFAVDASGKLPTGEVFSGPAQLSRFLLRDKRDEFMRCLAGKMLTYALGRGLEYYDRCAIDRIANTMSRNDYRFETLIAEIIKSAPFQRINLQKGQNPPETQASLAPPSR